MAFVLLYFFNNSHNLKVHRTPWRIFCHAKSIHIDSLDINIHCRMPIVSRLTSKFGEACFMIFPRFLYRFEFYGSNKSTNYWLTFSLTWNKEDSDLLYKTQNDANESRPIWQKSQAFVLLVYTNICCPHENKTIS